MLGIIYFFNEDDALSFAAEASDALYNNENGDLIITDRVYPSMKATSDGAQVLYVKDDVCGAGRDCFMVLYNLYGEDYTINNKHLQVF